MYVWNDSSQKCEDATANCIIGALYYSDGTCSQDKLSSKTLLGVVIYEKTLLGVVIYEKSASQNGWIMTVSPIQTKIDWGGFGTNIPGLTDYTSTPTDIQASCTNTDVITAYGSSSAYPAAWATKNYTVGEKTWCLPSGGLLNNINNSTNFAKINAGITIAGGTILGNVYSGYERVWSSSEHDSDRVWYFYAYTSGSFSMAYDGKTGTSRYYSSVRPVMAF